MILVFGGLRDPKDGCLDHPFLHDSMPQMYHLEITSQPETSLVLSRNSHFLCKGSPLPYWNNYLLVVVWVSRQDFSKGCPPTANTTLLRGLHWTFRYVWLCMVVLAMEEHFVHVAFEVTRPYAAKKQEVLLRGITLPTTHTHGSGWPGRQSATNQQAVQGPC